MTTDDLDALRNDYITTSMTIRQLADKYGMSKSALDRLVKKRGWNLERKAIEAAAVEMAQEHAKLEAIESVEDSGEETARPFVMDWDGTIGTSTAGQIRDALAKRRELIYLTTDELLRLTRTMLKGAKAMSPRDLQAMSSTLMNIKQLHDIRPEEEDKADASINVHMTGDVSSWAE